MNAFDEFLLLIAFAACFGIAICLLMLLIDYRKSRLEANVYVAPRHRHELAGQHSGKRTA